MPFKSKAQQRYMHAKADDGEISKKVVKEFDKETDFDNLPEKAKKKVEKKAGKFIEAFARGFFYKLAEMPPQPAVSVNPDQYGMQDSQQSLDKTPVVDSLPNDMGEGMPPPPAPAPNPLGEVLNNILKGQ